jgi:hypothetical protein
MTHQIQVIKPVAIAGAESSIEGVVMINRWGARVFGAFLICIHIVVMIVLIMLVIAYLARRELARKQRALIHNPTDQ